MIFNIFFIKIINIEIFNYKYIMEISTDNKFEESLQSEQTNKFDNYACSKLLE